MRISTTLLALSVLALLLLSGGVAAAAPPSKPAPVDRADGRPGPRRASVLVAGLRAVRLGARRAPAPEQDSSRLVRRAPPDDPGGLPRHAAPPGARRRGGEGEGADRREALLRQGHHGKNFEITIRLLGGLLSGYQRTGDPRLLHLAEDLGHRLLPVFDSPTGMPYMYVNLRTGKTSGARSNPAEIGTLLLEFGTLSKLTKNPVFYDKAKNALVQLYQRRSKIGLVGEEIDVETGRWVEPCQPRGRRDRFLLRIPSEVFKALRRQRLREDVEGEPPRR